MHFVLSWLLLNVAPLYQPLVGVLGAISLADSLEVVIILPGGRLLFLHAFKGPAFKKYYPDITRQKLIIAVEVCQSGVKLLFLDFGISI